MPKREHWHERKPKTMGEKLQYSLENAEDRWMEYAEDFGVEPELMARGKAEKIAAGLRRNDPLYRNRLARIHANLGEIIFSPEFRQALVDGGEEKPDRRLNQLSWCLNVLSDTGGGTLEQEQVESIRQSLQFAVLLKREMGNGGTVYNALKTAAKKLQKDKPAASYVPKSQRVGQEAPEPEAENVGPAPTRYEELCEDLYDLDKTLKLGLDMSRLDPESVVPAPDLSLATSWKDYQEAHTARIPYDPEVRKDRLARALVGAFQAGRISANQILDNGARPPKPYSKKLAEDYVRQLKEQPVFKKLCQDPKLVKDLLTPDPKHPNKQFNGMMNMFRPFGNLEPAKARAVLEKLRGMLPYMDRPEGRSKEWQDLYRSIEDIDLNDPLLDTEKKLQEVFDKNNAYMKGKKSMRGTRERQNRFNQSMDVLSVLSESGTYAKFAAQTVLDRVNEVRRGHDGNYRDITLRHFGADKLGRHANIKLNRYALDVLPEDPALLPPLPEQQRIFAAPVSEYSEMVEPLHSDQKLELMDTKLAIASAIILSKRKVYYLTGKGKTQEEVNNIRRKGRAVINKNNLESEISGLLNSPAVTKLAEKYKDPAARGELLRPVAPEPEGPQAQPGKKTVSWKDKNEETKYQKESALLKLNIAGKIPQNAGRLEEVDEDALVKTSTRRVNFYGPKDKPQYDPRKLNVEKLLQEYNQAVRETAPVQA